MSTPDVRITVYNHSMVTQALDVSAQCYSSVKYTDTPAGNGAALLTLGLHYEDVINLGYWTARNIVEISTGDCVLTQATSAGATRLFIDSSAPFDPAGGEDKQQTYLWDGAALTMQIPVLGVNPPSTTGPFWIDVGTPPSGIIPAYGAGTIVGRRRYTGFIMKRDMANEKLPRTAITCAGISRRLDEGVGSFAFNKINVASCIQLVLSQFATDWPEIPTAVIPIVSDAAGMSIDFSGSREHTTAAKMIADVLAAISGASVGSGDLYALRIGHDRTPRLLKLFDSISKAYTFNQTLPQGVLNFEPMSVKSGAEDAAKLFNVVKVIGDINPLNKQPVSATVSDPASITLYGRIEASPVTNTACKTLDACKSYAQAILNQQSLAVSANSFRIHTRNDY